MKREAGVASVIREAVFDFFRLFAEHGAEARASAEEAGGFAIGEFGGFGFVQINLTETGELQEFAFDHVLREVNQNIENGEITFAQGHFERLHVEPVAGKDAHVISPASIGAGAAAAGIGAVNHVIVDQRGAVDHFDHGAETNGAFAAISGRASGQEQQRGTQAFAAAFAKIAGNFADGLDGRAILRRDFLFDER